MRIFILKYDDSVQVTDTYDEHPYYVHKCYPKGQIFKRRSVGSMQDFWNVLHRDLNGNGPRWVFTTDKYVPEQVRLALILAD